MIEITTESLKPILAELRTDGLVAFSLACAERCRHAWDRKIMPQEIGMVRVSIAELNELMERLWENIDVWNEETKLWEIGYERCGAMLPNYDAGDEATLRVRILEDSILTVMHAIRCTTDPVTREATAVASTARSCVYEWYTRDIAPTVWGPMQFSEADVNIVTVEIAAQLRDATELAAGITNWTKLRGRAKGEAHRFV